MSELLSEANLTQAKGMAQAVIAESANAGEDDGVSITLATFLSEVLLELLKERETR